MNELITSRFKHQIAGVTDTDVIDAIEKELYLGRVSTRFHDPVVLELVFVSVKLQIDIPVQILVEHRFGRLDPRIPFSLVFVLEVADCIVRTI